MQSKHLLLVGPGFLGREILKLAQQDGWQVTAISRSGGEGIETTDISDHAQVRSLAERIQPSHIIHCASASGGGIEGYRNVYAKGCENLTISFPNAKILFTSSTSVYAQQDGSTVDESSEVAPKSETGKVLLEAENYILTAGSIVARLSGIYGAGRSYLIKRLLSGEAKIEGDGGKLLNHIHHVDGARACLFLLENGGASEIYNVTDNHSLTQLETYQAMCDEFGVPLPSSVENATPSKRGWSHKAVSNAKLRSLGWSPKYPKFVDTVREISGTL